MNFAGTAVVEAVKAGVVVAGGPMHGVSVAVKGGTIADSA